MGGGRAWGEVEELALSFNQVAGGSQKRCEMPSEKLATDELSSSWMAGAPIHRQLPSTGSSHPPAAPIHQQQSRFYQCFCSASKTNREQPSNCRQTYFPIRSTEVIMEFSLYVRYSAKNCLKSSPQGYRYLLFWVYVCVYVYIFKYNF